MLRFSARVNFLWKLDNYIAAVRSIACKMHEKKKWSERKINQNENNYRQFDSNDQYLLTGLLFSHCQAELVAPSVSLLSIRCWAFNAWCVWVLATTHAINWMNTRLGIGCGRQIVKYDSRTLRPNVHMKPNEASRVKLSEKKKSRTQISTNFWCFFGIDSCTAQRLLAMEIGTWRQWSLGQRFQTIWNRWQTSDITCPFAEDSGEARQRKMIRAFLIQLSFVTYGKPKAAVAVRSAKTAKVSPAENILGPIRASLTHTLPFPEMTDVSSASDPRPHSKDAISVIGIWVPDLWRVFPFLTIIIEEHFSKMG